MAAKKKKKKRGSRKKAGSAPAAAVTGAAPDAPAGEPRWKENLRWLSVAAVSGTLWFLACADFDIWPLAWIATVPLFFAIEGARTTRRAVLYGWFAGVVANGGGFYWIIGLLERFGGLPWPLAVLGYLLLCMYQAVVFLFFAWVVRRVREHTTLPMALVAPVVMCAFELAVPFIFPWYLAITQAWVVPVIQVAELAGPLGVTFLLLMVSGAVYDVITLRRKRLVAAGAAAGVFAASLVFGFVRIAQLETRRADAPKIQVGMVQPNISFDMKGFNNPRLRADQLRDLQERSRELEEAGADLIVWTESSYPYGILRDRPGDFEDDDPRKIRRGFTTPLVFGAVTLNRGERPYNTALMVDREGRFTGRFDKIFLLMFGEYIPGLETFPFLEKWLPESAGHFSRGEEIVTFPFTTEDGREWRLGPMICYEDIIPAFGRKLAKLRPHLLVNITNDAWFGDTSEPWEHLALSVYRAVELRTDLVRAVNTGVTAYIDATGRVYRETYAVDPAKDPRPAEGVLDEVALMEGGHTVYAAIGDLFGYACIAATLFLWLAVPRLRRRRAAA